MTKQEILDYFADINLAYNDASRYDTLANMLDNLESSRPRWISVKEKPPTDGQLVVCTDSEQRYVFGYICKSGSRNYGAFTARANNGIRVYDYISDVVAWYPMCRYGGNTND